MSGAFVIAAMNADRDQAAVSAALYAFQPNPQRARLVEARVRAGLAESLSAVFEALRGQGMVLPSDALLARVHSSPVAPTVFGAYTDLVEAIYANDSARVERVAAELCTPGFGSAGPLRLLTLSDADLGPGQSERYRRFMDDDPGASVDLAALTPERFHAESARVNEALALLEAAAPEIAGELSVLIREIVLVEHSDKSAVSFSGATSFQLWGALFLNAGAHTSRVEIAEALAHETAHALLFGFSLGRPLVENEAAVRYVSPLRPEPRPMDGVVHASYVLARMHYAVSKLLASNLLSVEERRAAEEARARNAQRYAGGIGVIDDHVAWTPPGEAAFASVRSYMREAAQA